jgi:Gpi18-like mannosyltransferase
MQESFKSSHKGLYISAFAIWFLGIVLTPEYCHGWDNYCWGYWSEIIHNKGLAAVYADKSPINYPPIFIYLLKLYGNIVPIESLFKYTYTLKAITWTFDVGSLIIIGKWMDNNQNAWKYISLIALSPAWFYNTMIWNQVDGILAFWVLLALQSALNKQAKWAVFLSIIALNFKIQAIVSIPLIGLICLYNKDYKGILIGLVWGIIAQIIIVLPFIQIGQLHRVWLMATGSMDYFPYVSMNAHNLWHLIYNGDLTQMPDANNICFGITIKSVGLSLFFLSSMVILWPLIKSIIKLNKVQVNAALNPESILLMHCLISFVFFYFNTQMHERYIHPAIVSSVLLAVIYMKWWQWLFFGLIYFFSLESILQFLGLHIYHTGVFHPKVIAVLYAILGLYWSYLMAKTPLFKTAT